MSPQRMRNTPPHHRTSWHSPYSRKPRKACGTETAVRPRDSAGGPTLLPGGWLPSWGRREGLELQVLGLKPCCRLQHVILLIVASPAEVGRAPSSQHQTPAKCVRPAEASSWHLVPADLSWPATSALPSCRTDWAQPTWLPSGHQGREPRPSASHAGVGRPLGDTRWCADGKEGSGLEPRHAGWLLRWTSCQSNLVSLSLRDQRKSQQG